MTEQNNAPEAPAPAVEATQGAEPGQSPTSPTSENVASSANAPAGDAPAQAESQHEGDDEGEESGEEGGADEASQAAGGTDAAKKKRRRRRKKKPAQAGAEGAAKEGEGPRAERGEKPAKEGQGGVFARFFDSGSAGKRHAFSAGEVVAGRVSAVNPGGFTVDLFGKALAYVDIFEPHDVPVLPDPPPAAEAAAEVATDAQPVEGQAEGTEAAGATDAQPVEGQGQAEGTEAAVEAAAAEPVAVVEAPAVEVAQADVAAESVPEADAAESVSAEEGGSEEAHDEANDEAEPEPEPPPAPELGSIFRGRVGSVAESGHIVIVNRIIDTQAAKQRIARAREQRRRVRGVVFGFNRGGFDVLVEGVRVFCPASGMSLTPVENPEELLGQRLEFTVPPSKAGTHGFVVSRRGILERQQRKAVKQLFRSLQPGQRLKGKVTQVREFGIFVDLGGIEGLVHQSELSFSRGVRPQDAAKPGDEVEVQVLRVGEGQTRRERERVSLSMKALQDDPWTAHTELLEPGNVITGKVVRTTDFGAFIEISPQIEGLLHISELGRELKHANQALTDGQELRVVVERVDRKARRISLSKLSQAEEKALEAGIDSKSGRPPKPGAHLKVVVDKIDPGGVVVQIPGVFGRRGRGFIPNSEMGTERGTDHRKGFPPGTEIPVKAIGVDRDGGHRFSRKALLVEEEKRAVQDYRREVARQGLGTFGDLLRAKLEGGKQG